MENFAATTRVYSDGQNNREEVPAEIVQYGFKPPVKLPDGSIEVGDYLAANHLNFIINDIYKKLSTSLVVTEKSGNTNAGYRKFSNGDIEAWGRAVTGADGSVTVNYGIQMPAPTGDIQATDSGGANDNTSIKVTLPATVTGFTIRAGNVSGAPLSGRVVIWRAVYHG